MSNLTKKSRYLLSILVLALFTIACGTAETQPYYVRNAHAHDTLWGAERLNDGETQIWLTHDDTAVYCTADKTLGDKLMNLISEKTAGDIWVNVTYRNRTSDEKYTNNQKGSLYWCAEGFSNTIPLTLISVEVLNK